MEHLNTAGQHAGLDPAEQQSGKTHITSNSWDFPFCLTHITDVTRDLRDNIHTGTRPIPAVEQALCEGCLGKLHIGTCPSQSAP